MAPLNSIADRLLFATFMLWLFESKLVLSSIPRCTTVTINSTATVNSSAVVADYEYASLQDALEWAGTQQNNNCTEIVLLPGEQYFIVRPVTIGSSLVLRSSSPRGRAEVILRVERTPRAAENYSPLFDFTARNTNSVSIEGVNFSGSSGIITMQNVTNVVVSNCIFSYFSEGALDIYNCPMVTVTDCMFEHNGPVAYTLKLDPFRGHSGGLSIGCNNLTHNTTSPLIVIQNNLFVNNSAFPSEELIQSTSNLFTNSLFTGRGGALIVLLSESLITDIHVVVDNCMFESNSGESFGGAVYTLFEKETAHVVTYHNCTFKQNWSGFAAGGLLGVFFGSGSNDRFSFMNVSHCLFVENVAQQGGGSYVLLPDIADEGGVWNFARFEYCSFQRNVAFDFAAALTFINPEVFRYRARDRPFEIHSCTFLNNSHRGSTTFGSAFVPVVFEGETIFSGCVGSAIQLAGSLMSLKGSLNITNSDTISTNNGAMHFTTYSQLQLFKGSDIYFANNIGAIGASFTTEFMDNYRAFKNLLYNPLCFLLYEDSRIRPDRWANVSIRFSQNRAFAGAVGFFPSLEVCSWVRFRDPFFDKKSVLNWNFVNLGNNTNTFHKDDPTNPVWYTQTETYSLYLEEHLVELYPGEKLNLHFTALDELSEPVATFIRLVSQDDSDAQGANVEFDPSLDLYDEMGQPLNAVTLANYKPGLISTNGMLLSQTVLVENFLQQTSAEDSFVLQPKVCPAGYLLQPVAMENNESICTCDANNSDILFCNGGLVAFTHNLWATSTNDTEDKLYVHHCPPGYCQCQVTSDFGEETCLYIYNEQKPDEQCSCLRSGVLCGKCNNGSGVSALLNRCVSCDHTHALLIVLLVLVDVVMLVPIILFLTSPIPNWLYPCLFYLQFLSFSTESIQLGFEISRNLMLYVASGLSFYFPFDACLYGGASPLITYSLRFMPLLVDIVIFPVTFLFIWRFMKRRFLLPCYSLWLVILLQYMHIVYSAMSILHCAKVPISDNTTEIRWFVNGEIRCFVGGHLILALFAIIVLITCTALIPLTVILISGKLSKISWLSQLREPLLQAGFSSESKWWFSADLARRLLVILMTVCSPGSIYPVFFTTCIFTTVVLYIQPYQSRLANFLEAILSINAILFFMMWIPESFQTLDLFTVTDDSQCSNANGSSVYIFAKVVFFTSISYYIPFLVTVFVVLSAIAVVLFKTILRKLTKTVSGSKEVGNKSFRDRAYTGLITRAGVTKTSVLLHILSSSTLTRGNHKNTAAKEEMELSDAENRSCSFSRPLGSSNSIN